MNKPSKRRLPAVDLQTRLSDIPAEARHFPIQKWETPEQLIAEATERSITMASLITAFEEKFPHESVKHWIDANPDMRRKHVQGLGDFIFTSRPGKMDFHEHLLDIVLATLKQKRIQARRGSKRRGADFFIFNQGKKTYCEIETGLFNRSEHRPNLEARIRRYPDRCIILVCNQVDKKRYQHSSLRFQVNREPVIMTIWEFLNGGAWRKRFLEVNVR